MVNLNQYDLVIINSSGGKDSLCAVFAIYQMAKKQGYPISQCIISHQDLGRMEWPGTKELAEEQAKHFGMAIEYSKRRNKEGYNETLLEYAKRRGKWPSNKQRWCTSDYKRAPGMRVVTRLTKDMGNCKVLYVFGFRAEESPARSKKEVLTINKKLTTQKRTVHEFLPIHDWSTQKVWEIIKSNNLPYHYAYKLGMPRLSCVFCIFSPFDALVLAGKHNPELLNEYVEVEAEIENTFKQGTSLKEVQEAIQNGYEPTNISNWVM